MYRQEKVCASAFDKTIINERIVQTVSMGLYRDLEKFRTLPLYISPGTSLENSDLSSYISWVWDLEIPVQVPEIKTCFMSIDEIARIFSKSQSLYRGGEIGKAFIRT